MSCCPSLRKRFRSETSSNSFDVFCHDLNSSKTIRPCPASLLRYFLSIVASTSPSSTINPTLGIQGYFRSFLELRLVSASVVTGSWRPIILLKAQNLPITSDRLVSFKLEGRLTIFSNIQSHGTKKLSL